MTLPAILLPVFVQVALTFVVMVWMGRARWAAGRSGEVTFNDIALGEPNWPRKPQLISNNFDNQFQLPLLFYVLVVLAITARKADLLFVVMSWLFVGSRIVHTVVHTGSNHIPHRFRVFAIGALTLLAMWIIFAVRVLTGL